MGRSQQQADYSLKTFSFTKLLWLKSALVKLLLLIWNYSCVFVVVVLGF